jgi:peptide/nickel transport system substrate-binding protein
LLKILRSHFLIGVKAALATAVVLGGVAAAPIGASVIPSARSGTGGSLADLAVGSQWPGLDPATNTQDAADANYENAIFGELFELDPGGKIVPDEASGYQFTNHNLTFEIFLRHGIKFSDGTPFNAQAVQMSIERDLVVSNGCLCLPNFTAVSSITTKGAYTVVIHLSKLYSPILSAFITEAPNWTVDPTALAQEGEAAYAQHPIGAGPFEVVSNTASATLVLNANPRYFVKGEPHLKSLTFTSVASDESAYAALQSGQVQMATAVSTIPLLQQIKSSQQFNVNVSPATGFNFIALNALDPPFNNIIAREAVAYATNSKTIVGGLYDNFYKTTESPSAPGDVFYEQTVPGYRTYNLAKAKALVQQLGGLTVTLGTLTNTAQYANESSAIATMWEAAGIKVNLVLNSLQECLVQLTSHTYQALDTQWGQNIDNGVNDPIYWTSGGAWSGINDPEINGLLNQGVSYASHTTRAKVYAKIALRLSQQQDDVFLYSHPTFSITAKSVTGVASGQPELHFETLSVR